MAEINDLNVNPATNTGRFPEGMLVPQINDAGRDLEAALARQHKDLSAVGITSGTATAYSLVPFRTRAAYAAGDSYIVRFHVANTGAATMAVGGLAAKPLLRQSNAALAAGDILVNQVVHIVYNASNDSFVCIGIGAVLAGLDSYTLATLPAASGTKRMIYVSDETGGATPAFNDGTNWRRVTDRAIVS
jgi:hypothetical protein